MSQTSSSSDFNARLIAVADDVELMLGQLLDEKAFFNEIHRPERLLEAMRYASLGGGKRLRPFLVMESARMLGASGQGVLRAACALEFVHCYSLVHDDLPAMDDDDLRRGRPTVHKAFDEAIAILAGDSLLTFAFDVMGDVPTHDNPAIRAELVVGLARASGLGGMAGGQALDLAAEASATPLAMEEILRLQAMKTGALLRFGVEAGAILGGASAAERQALVAYGLALGAAFQIADDILDATSDAATLGKQAGKDEGRNKATLVSVLGLEAARVRCADLVAEAEGALERFDSRADVLREAARFTMARKS